MKRIGIIGHLGDSLDGQTVKTKIFTEELKGIYSSNDIDQVDLYGGVKRMILFKVFLLLKNSRNIIIFPAHNAVRVLGPFLAFLNIFFNRTLHYVVIGGWLPQFLYTRKWLLKSLLKFDYLYVETSTMKHELEKLGFTNVVILPNCKNIKRLDESQMKKSYKEPYPLCTLSRVNFKKGIEDAIKVVKTVNERYGRIVYTLDIYGPIAEDYMDRFESIMSESPDYISYKGTVDFDKTVEVLKDYFALLFPTHYFTEGIPGTIIDSYAAGLPVISARWESFSDLVEDGVVGIGYEFDNFEQFNEILLRVATNPQEFTNMKKSCLILSENFTSETVVARMKNYIKDI